MERLGLDADQRQAFGVVRGFDPEANEELDELLRMGASLVYTAHKSSGLIHDLVNEEHRRSREAGTRDLGDDVDLGDDMTGDFIEEPAASRLPSPPEPRGLEL